MHSCLEVATFESRVAELKPCVHDLEMYTSEQLQSHAVIAAWVNQSKSLFHCTEWVNLSHVMTIFGHGLTSGSLA